MATTPEAALRARQHWLVQTWWCLGMTVCALWVLWGLCMIALNPEQLAWGPPDASEWNQEIRWSELPLGTTIPVWIYESRVILPVLALLALLPAVGFVRSLGGKFPYRLFLWYAIPVVLLAACDLANAYRVCNMGAIQLSPPGDAGREMGITYGESNWHAQAWSSPILCWPVWHALLGIGLARLFRNRPVTPQEDQPGSGPG